MKHHAVSEAEFKLGGSATSGEYRRRYDYDPYRWLNRSESGGIKSFGESRRTDVDKLRADVGIGCRICRLSLTGDNGETLLKYWRSQKTFPIVDILTSIAILQEEAAVDLLVRLQK